MTARARQWEDGEDLPSCAELGGGCVVCAEPMLHGRRLFCSDTCARKGEIHRRKRRRRFHLSIYNKMNGCNVCGSDMPHDAPRSRLYCSNACRQKAYRERRLR